MRQVDDTLHGQIQFLNSRMDVFGVFLLEEILRDLIRDLNS